MTHWGYYRASARNPDAGPQIEALIAAGVDEHSIIGDEFPVTSGNTALPALSRILAEAKQDDTVVVCGIDRMGRSLLDLVTTIEQLSARGVGIRSIDDEIDPSTPGGRRMVELLGSLAGYERALVAERVRAGVAAAHRSGVRLGRPPLDAQETSSKLLLVARARAEGRSATEAARLVGWSRATYYRHLDGGRDSESG